LAWRIEFDAEAEKDLARIDRHAAREIRRFLRERVATDEDPRRFGDPLVIDRPNGATHVRP